MAHRKGKVQITWNANFAYVLGIIAADGNLSPDGRHINITSKDYELVLKCKKSLGLKNKIGRKARGGSINKKYSVLQFGDIVFYNFLIKISFTPNKSRTLSKIQLPQQYFRDFLRGCIDGDGSISISRHPESNHDQYKIRLCSGSRKFLV